MSRKPPGAKAKLRQYLLDHIGETLTSRELQEVSGGVAEWARRIRELRDEEGFDIVTHNDLSSLKPGEYVLRSGKPRPAFARGVSKETRALVLARNGFTCQMCGAGAGEPSPYDPSKNTRLHIGHIVDKSHGGSDDLSNLRAVCSVCNEGAANISLATGNVKQVLAQLRKTPRHEQLDVLEFLVRKFPDETGALLNDDAGTVAAGQTANA
jgi:hypothetical protein